MKHYGDITKISGAEVEPVDVICGGSPCQDLSVAGKRAGLAGERSGLFMEQIRIIKEMREHDRLHCGRTNESVRPRYMVWENVAGAFSSGSPKGEDFRIVLEETARVVAKDAIIPGPPNGKWSYAGCIVGDGWSIAWRTHNSQYWGVPQRRRRISLVADFGGTSAAEILFERDSMPGHIAPSRAKGEAAPGNTEGSLGAAISFQERAGKPGGGKGILIQDEHTGALNQNCGQSVCYKPGGLQISHESAVVTETNGSATYAMETFHCQAQKNIANVLRARDYKDPQVVCVSGFDSYNQAVTGDISKAITSAATDSDHLPLAMIYCKTGEKAEAVQTVLEREKNSTPGDLIVLNDQGGQQMSVSVNVSATLRASEHGHQPIVFEGGAASRVGGHIYTNGITGAIRANAGDNQQAVAYDARGNGDGKIAATITGDHENRITDYTTICMNSTIVRRLTPKECERLQGFPDDWTNIGDWIDSKGKLHKGDSDSPRYKALGNSIALPFWQWMAQCMAKHLPENATMASLFDGIGGFPLVFSRSGVKPVWASEIEEFPIAVTKIRFPEVDE